MKKHRLLDTRAGYILASLGMLFGVLAPAVIPVVASAGAVNSRSITMSSATPGATGVTYELKGTLDTALTSAGGLVLQFCNNASGPLVGLGCTVPTGMSTASPTLVSGGGTLSSPASDELQWLSGAAVSAGTAIDLVISGITNPTTAGTFYARITTYVNAPDYAGPTTPGTVADQGGFALALNNTFDITAYVQETLTFCVSGYDSTATPNGVPGKTCNSGSLRDPSMTIGEPLGTQKVLDPGFLSTGLDYAQVSSNAAHGVVVNLQSSTTGCGGLVRLNDSANCDIKPQNVTTNSITAGQALFGIQLGASADGSGDATGVGTLVPSGSYSTSKYFMDYATGDATGVTSTYGSALFNSSNAPVGSMNIPINFGVSAAANTPAGIYSATLNLVATGTF